MTKTWRHSSAVSRYKYKLDEEQKITAVVNAAGREYANTIQQETLILGIKNLPVTTKALVKAMYE